MKPLKSPALMFSRIKTGLILFGLLLIAAKTQASESPHLSKAELEEIRTLGVEVPQEIQTLLAQRQRPLPHDLLAAFGGKLPENMPDYLSLASEGSMSNFTEVVPPLIAALERLWPNGRYVSLGRDAVITTDILDAFYRNLGQTDRTARIDASGASIRPGGKYVGAKTVNPFLERTIGLNLNTLKRDRPLVMMDRTGFSDGSQSRMILRGLYDSALRKGIPKEKLPTLLSFASLDPDYENLTPYELETFLTKQNKELGEGARIFTQIPTLPGYTDLSEWHDTWSTFRKQADGKRGTLPGKPAPLIERLAVLADFYTILSQLQSPAFTKALYQAFSDFKLKFDPSGNAKSVKLRKMNLDLLGNSLEEQYRKADAFLHQQVQKVINEITKKKNHEDADYLAEDFFEVISDHAQRKRDNMEKDRFFYEDLTEKAATLLFHYAVRSYRNGKLPKESLTNVFDICFQQINGASGSSGAKALAFAEMRKDLSIKGVLVAASSFSPHLGFHANRKLKGRRTRLLR